MKLQQIAQKIGAQYKGDADYEVQGFGNIARIEKTPHENLLYFLETKKMWNKYPLIKKAKVVLTTNEFAEHFEDAIFCEKQEARLKFIAALELFQFRHRPPSYSESNHSSFYVDKNAVISPNAIIYPSAVVLEGAKISDGAILYPGAVIEPYAKVGKNSIIHANTVIGHHCIIGDNCTIFGGTVIGADGFGFYDHPDGTRHKIPQIGNVVIQNDVEIGAGCTIDRATMESTFIGQQTKLDDQVHIGHNCYIGEYVYMAGSAVLAGSVTIEDRAIIAGQATIAEGVTIHKKAVLLGMSATQRDIEAGGIYFGAVQAMPVKLMHKVTSLLAELPEIAQRLKSLEDKKAD